MSISDFFIIFSLLLFIPYLVTKSLGEYGFCRRVLIAVCLGGMAWVLLSCVHDILITRLELVESDANIYEGLAYTNIMGKLEQGDYSSVLESLFSPGKLFYVSLQGLIYYFTGATPHSMIAINSFMAFWGSLMLSRLIYSFSGRSVRYRTILLFFIVFTPSVVFWSSSNLKEGLMYWSICIIYSLVVQCAPNIRFQQYCLLLSGIFIGSLLRPHIIALWVLSVLLVKLVDRRFWRNGIILLAVFIFFGGVTNKIIKSINIKDKINFANSRKDLMVQRGGGSTFDYGESGPIHFVSGAVNIAFRPFPWRVKNLKTLLASLEIWTMSIGIIIGWVTIPWNMMKNSLREPSVRAALLVCVPIFFFFTFLPNEGLIARQRIMVFPALLVLFATPILQRRAQRIEPTGQRAASTRIARRTKD